MKSPEHITAEQKSSNVISSMFGRVKNRAEQMPNMPTRIQVDPDVRVIELSRALASAGLCLRHNPETDQLYLTRAK